jgi:GNAT superfamily N-acetyltransferase
MSDSGIRPVTPADNDALIEIERACPQGSRLIMHSERKDYLYRAKLFGNHHTMVAVDHGRVFGVLAATLKKVLIDGEEVDVAYFYDLRVHPDFRRTVSGRNMLKVWFETEKWAKDSGAQVMYGMIKGDNETMLGMQRRKRAYKFSGKMLIVSRPVYREQSVNAPIELVDLSLHGKDLAAEVFAEYGSKNLFPANLTSTYLTGEMEKTGLFSCYRIVSGDSWASVGLYKISRETWMRVLKLPWYYRVMRPLFETLRPVIPLPVIPAEGDQVRYYHVFNHLVRGPAGDALWKKLMAHINNLAFSDGTTIITGSFCPGDRFYSMFKHGAMNTIPYRIGYKSLSGDREYTFSSFAPDVRDMD